ncbi:MAG: thioesterase family protein [Phycicoccus sp.]
MYELDEALGLTWSGAVATGTAGDGWVIGHAVNGGILMALAVQALGERTAAAGHPDVLAWSAFFLSATSPGPVEVHTEVLRTGRSVSTAQARLVQADTGRPDAGRSEGGGADADPPSSDLPDGDPRAERVRLTATFGALEERAEPVHRAPEPPGMPSPEECPPARREGSPLGRSAAILDRLDLRVDPETAGFATGRPSGRGVIRAWLRCADGREPDLAMLPLAVDALMPVAFDLGAPGWAPTLELSGQALGRPAPGWLRVELRTDTVVGEQYVEDADVWDSTGRLVARSRQLAGIRMPGPPAG